MKRFKRLKRGKKNSRLLHGNDPGWKKYSPKDPGWKGYNKSMR